MLAAEPARPFCAAKIIARQARAAYIKRTMSHKKGFFYASLALCLLAVTPAFGVSREIVQLQTQVQALQESMARMQQAFDERMGVMKNLIEQSTDNINKMTSAVETLQKSVQQSGADSGNRVDQLSGQIQALHDSLDELKARVAKLNKQIDDMNAAKENLQPGAPGAAPPSKPLRRAIAYDGWSLLPEPASQAHRNRNSGLLDHFQLKVAETIGDFRGDFRHAHVFLHQQLAGKRSMLLGAVASVVGDPAIL